MRNGLIGGFLGSRLTAAEPNTEAQGRHLEVLSLDRSMRSFPALRRPSSPDRAHVHLTCALFAMSILFPAFAIPNAIAQTDDPAPQEGGSDEVADLPRVESDPNRIRLDLAALLDDADVFVPVAEIDFGKVGDINSLSAGFEWPFVDNDEPFDWITGPVAVVDLPLFTRRERSLELEVGAFPKQLNLPAQFIGVYFNGRHVKHSRLAPGWNSLKLQVREDLQRLGLNRIELMPNFRLTSINPTDWNAPARLGVKVSRLSIGATAPRIGTKKRMPRVEQGVIIQHPQTLIDFSLALPREPVLYASGSLVIPPHLRGRDLEGSLALTTLDTAGRTEEILNLELGKLSAEPNFEVRSNFGKGPRDMVSIQLALSVRGSGAHEFADLAVRWQELRIEGTSVPAPTPKAELARGKYNVLLVLFDSLRADHTEPYGATDVSTPEMREFSEAGVTFKHAYANATWTRPSVASLLTSRRLVGQSIHQPDKASVPPSAPYLPEILNRGGYHTVLVTNNALVSHEFGFDRGFDEVHPFYEVREEMRKEHRTPAAQANHVWESYIAPALDERGDAPFFIYLHELDPHGPYEPVYPYADLYPAPYRGFVPVNDNGNRHINLLSSPRGKIDRSEASYLDARYRGEISFMDAYLGELLSRLARSGLERDTLVIFASDHGEAFMEHQTLGHGGVGYEEVARVPLIFRLPGVLPGGLEVQDPVQLADVAPTVLDLLGIEIPPEMQGRSLLDMATNPESSSELRPIISSSMAERHHTLRYGDWKLIRTNGKRLGRLHGMTSYKLFNIREDPEEIYDRWARQPVVGRTLAQMLRRRNRIDTADTTTAARAEESPPEQRILDPAVLKDLKALGYID